MIKLLEGADPDTVRMATECLERRNSAAARAALHAHGGSRAGK